MNFDRWWDLPIRTSTPDTSGAEPNNNPNNYTTPLNEGDPRVSTHLTSAQWGTRGFPSTHRARFVTHRVRFRGESRRILRNMSGGRSIGGEDVEENLNELGNIQERENESMIGAQNDQERRERAPTPQDNLIDINSEANHDARESIQKRLERKQRELDEREKQMFARQQEQFDMMHTLHAEMAKCNKERRRSRGVRLDSDEHVNKEESHTTHQQRRSANVGNSFAAVAGQPASMGPMFVNFIQQKELKSFSNLANEDPREFVERYERLSSQWEDRAKVENFATYLEGAASDWLTVLKYDLTKIMTISDEGIQSNGWLDFKWPELCEAAL